MKSNILNKILFVFIFVFLISGVFADLSDELVAVDISSAIKIKSISSNAQEEGVLGIGDKIEFFIILTDPIIEGQVSSSPYNGENLDWITDDYLKFRATYVVKEGQDDQVNPLQLKDVMVRNDELKTPALSGDDVKKTIDATKPIVGDLVLDIINSKNLDNYILSINLKTEEKNGIIKYDFIDEKENKIQGNIEINELLNINHGEMPLSFNVGDLSRLVDGKITFNIEVIDVAGNKTIKKETIQKVTVLPEIGKVNLYPINLDNQNKYNLEIVTDLNLTDWVINLEIFNFNTNELIYLISKTSKKISDSGYSLSENIDLISLVDDKYKFKVTITDLYGNTSKEFEQDIVKDTISPVLTLDNSIPIRSNQPDLKITGTIISKLYEIIKVRYKISTEDELFTDCVVQHSPSEVVGYNYVTCDINGLSDGNYEILIQSEDSVFNQQDIKISVSISTLLVNLEIENEDRVVRNKDNYPKFINGNVILNPNATSKIIAYLSPINGFSNYRKYEVFFEDRSENGSFVIELNNSVSGTQPELPLIDGEYLLSVRLSDDFGNAVFKTQKIVIDSLGPETTIDELITTNRTPIITGKTTSGLALTNDVNVTINNKTYLAVIDGENWSVQITEDLPIGAHSVKVIAKDEATNETEETKDGAVTITQAPIGGGGGTRIYPAAVPAPVETPAEETPAEEPTPVENQPEDNTNTGGETLTPVETPIETPQLEEAPIEETPTPSGLTGFAGFASSPGGVVTIVGSVLLVIGAVGYFFLLRPR